MNECYKCHNTKDLELIMVNNWLDNEPPSEDYICSECINKGLEL